MSSKLDEYCQIILHHIEMSDRIPDGDGGVYQDERYLLPTQVVETYGDSPDWRDGNA